MKTDRVGVILFVLLLLSVAGSGCVDSAVNQTTSNNGSAVGTPQQENSSLQSTTDPNTVPIETAYNQSLAAFWSFTLDGPYSSDPNWTSAALDPEPVILYDINGKPQYYEFYLTNGGAIIWTGANKILGHGVFRFYQEAPSYNHSQIAQDAERVVKTRYPDYPILSNIPALYGGSYPMLSRMLKVRNTSSGASERIIVDAFTHEIVPDHASEDYKGNEYAWSYLDSIPQSEYPDRVAQWELQDSDASRIVEYTLARGIDVRLPLTPQNASIIRNYSAVTSPVQSGGVDSNLQEEDESYLQNDGRPITDEMIRENVVPVDTARIQAQSYLWRRQVDRPEIYEDLSYRGTTISSRDPVAVMDINGRLLFYVFSVERGGQHLDWIVIGANRILGNWLNMPSERYNFENATKKALDIAGKEFPGSVVQSSRLVYCNDASRWGLWMVLSLDDPSTDEKHRIVIDTLTLNATLGKIPSSGGNEEFPSLFSRVEPGESSRWIGLWNKENKKDRALIAYARSQGIPVDRSLTDGEIVTLGTYILNILKATPVYGNHPVFNPLYPEPAVRPTLSKETLAWHEQADWFSVIDVDASLSTGDIERIISSHHISYNYTLRVVPMSIARNYYLRVSESDYNRTFSILTSNGSAFVPEQVTGMREYLEILKRENGTITIPVAIGPPQEANFLHLKAQGVHLDQMKTVYVNFDYGVKKAEREKILAELNADERVLFARKEYPG